MSKIFIWNPDENQTYDIPGPYELSAASFDKEAGKSFTMIPPAGTLMLLSRQSSVWGGHFDNAIPPTEIDLRSGALVLRGVSGDPKGVDFTMGPYPYKLIGHPFVNFTLTDASFEASHFDKVNAGGLDPLVLGMYIDLLLDLKLAGASRYQVDCGLYASTKRLLVKGRSAVKVRADEVVLTFSEYFVLPTELPRAPGDDHSLNLEATGGKLEIAESRFAFGNSAKSAVKSKKITLRKSVRVAAQDSARATFVTDAVEFYDSASTAIFSIADHADVEFDTYSGGKPFDFLSNRQYPEGLFNFQSSPQSRSTGKFTLYGAGSAFEQSAMLNKRVVAIDGVPQSDSKRLKFDYVPVGNTQNMVVSLR
ncbi:hypothetical protein P350_34980 [Burkholderia cepacia JBK9]|nr:hypothetical protein [Burkholderia arboris]ALX16838.1 hypothetical protein P350_34980 [Burkholderia cepacia JBK9]MCA8489289.1 hypothetical protein [Burkholderia arboris]UTV59753.1 hypothetical protein NLX30_36795 [Burkholderia arboris]VWB51150.1 hypothetical protein BAR24066_02330 [Burkholderia arboris]